MKIIYVKQIPIRVINSSNQNDKRKRNCLIEMVETMLDLQKKYNDARLENDKSMYKKHVEILDLKIDRLVYELYDLTDEEIEIVGA